MSHGCGCGATESGEPEAGGKTGAERGPFLLDVRKLDGPQKHPTIHRMFDDLEDGQALTIVNDHEPRPLYYELQAERPERFDAENYRAYQADDRVWVAVLPTRVREEAGTRA